MRVCRDANRGFDFPFRDGTARGNRNDGEKERGEKKTLGSEPRENESCAFSLFLASDTEPELLGACSAAGVCSLSKQNEGKRGKLLRTLDSASTLSRDLIFL